MTKESAIPADRFAEAGEAAEVAEDLAASAESAPAVRDFERRPELGAALRRVKSRERELLWLAYAEGFSHKEIAELTGLKATSLRPMLFRARKKLARLLGRDL